MRPDRGGLPGHHAMLDYIPHVTGQHRGPLWLLCKEGNCRVVSTHQHQVWACAHLPFCTLTRQVLIQGKLGHVSWSSHQTHPEKVPQRG